METSWTGKKTPLSTDQLVWYQTYHIWTVINLRLQYMAGLPREGGGDLVRFDWLLYHWMWNFKNIWDLKRACSYLVHNSCYTQVGPGEGQVTCSKRDDLYLIRCKISRRYEIWRGVFHIWSNAIAKANLVIISKNGMTKAQQNVTYNILPGPIFHVESGSEVRILVSHLHHNRCSNH
jgi:hypothetical protein